MNDYFHSLFTNILSRSVESTLGVLGIKNLNLRKHLEHQLQQDLRNGNRLLADPVFEATYPWEEVKETFADLGQRGFLTSSFVEALNTEHRKVRFDDQELDLSSQVLKSYWHPRR